jgi:hypothetical protein
LGGNAVRVHVLVSIDSAVFGFSGI